ncbi:integrase, catalytic region, zinc finger, CCHC-type containing protein [Tanacetum coccineum]
MMGQRSQLINFVRKFIGTVRFRNDHVAAIRGYGDYQIGNVTISQVYYVDGLGHNLFSVGQFCDSNFKVAFRKHTCYVRDLEGKSMKHTHKPKSDDSIQEKLYLLHMDLCGPIRIESINGKKYILVIVDDYSQFTWAETAATPSPAKKAYRIYNRQTRLIMETIHVEFDQLTAMDFKQFDSGPELQLMTPGIISSGLVPNSPSTIPYIPPTKNDWDFLFRPMFDECFNPLLSVVFPVPAAALQDLLIQPVHLRQLPLIKMHHQIVLHQQHKKRSL